MMFRKLREWLHCDCRARWTELNQAWSEELAGLHEASTKQYQALQKMSIAIALLKEDISAVVESNEKQLSALRYRMKADATSLADKIEIVLSIVDDRNESAEHVAEAVDKVLETMERTRKIGLNQVYRALNCIEKRDYQHLRDDEKRQAKEEQNELAACG